MREKHTSVMFAELRDGETFAKFVGENIDCFIEQSFAEYITMLGRERGVSHSQVIRDAQIDRVYGQQIFSGVRKPSRDKVIQLAFGFSLTLDETQKLLQIGGKSRLYPKIKRDAAIIFGLNNGFDLQKMQELLYEAALPLLGEQKIYE